MPKHVAVLCYSQTGQLLRIAKELCKGFTPGEIEIEWVTIEPEHPFPFPWKTASFFDVMPESVLGVPIRLKDPSFKRATYDLVIFCFQPWFLSPSLPSMSALHHPSICSRLNGTPVVTVCGARNMWITAQERINGLLRAAGAVIEGNIVLTDRNPNLVSAVTIQYWMFTGKRDRLLGIFPRPGISEKDIKGASAFGALIQEALQKGFDRLQSKLVTAGGMNICTSLMFVESRASVIFRLWARKIMASSRRKLLLRLFRFYLTFALFLVAPVVLLFYTIFIRPFSLRAIRRKKDQIIHLQTQT